MDRLPLREDTLVHLHELQLLRCSTAELGIVVVYVKDRILGHAWRRLPEIFAPGRWHEICDFRSLECTLLLPSVEDPRVDTICHLPLRLGTPPLLECVCMLINFVQRLQVV
jgi:hypothetical protein